jgi:hypothetical protein
MWVRRALLATFVLTMGCTDPLAGNWQSHGPDLIGDFELFLDEELGGRIDFRYRREDSSMRLLEGEVTATRVERADGVWTYDLDTPDGSNLFCDLDRPTDELTCRWSGKDLNFDLFEASDAVCNHSVCTTGRALESSCDDCTALVCEFDKYCCHNAWDSTCRYGAIVRCDALCP